MIYIQLPKIRRRHHKEYKLIFISRIVMEGRCLSLSIGRHIGFYILKNISHFFVIPKSYFYLRFHASRTVKFEADLRKEPEKV